jgi:anti-anti-sigma factor
MSDDAANLELLERGALLRARLTGEVDLSNAAEFEAAIIDLVPNEAVGMVLDLTALSYLDSSGIRMLLTLVGRFAWRGQQLAIVSPEGSRVRRVLQLAGASEALVVDTADDDAIARLLDRGGQTSE